MILGLYILGILLFILGSLLILRNLYYIWAMNQLEWVVNKIDNEKTLSEVETIVNKLLINPRFHSGSYVIKRTKYLKKMIKEKRDIFAKQ